MKAMGIDIGTTTISMVMVDGESGCLLGRSTVASDSFIRGLPEVSKVQDPEKILQIVTAGIRAMVRQYGKPDCIGLTGQMHGVLYTDQEGRAVSPLYTWQDGCGNLPLTQGPAGSILPPEQEPAGGNGRPADAERCDAAAAETEDSRGAASAAEILREAGCAAASGYGLTTHFYMTKTGQVPADAAGMATISDYIGMRLCGLKEPEIALDMAASWGCVDLESGRFRTEVLEKLGVDTSLLPKLRRDHGVLGYTMGSPADGSARAAAGSGMAAESGTGDIPAGIPVMLSLGDNQASFLGSVCDLSDTLLVNIGTGSQISVSADRYYDVSGNVELRPLVDDAFIMVGCGLCGGRAFAMLEQFFSEAAGTAKGSFYGPMIRMAEDFYEQKGREKAWQVSTTFSGSRADPDRTGSMTGITIGNFSPGAMTLGMICGIIGELQEYSREIGAVTGARPGHMVGSGNGIRRNVLMQRMAEEMFGMPMQIPECEEEAAYGAALESLYGAGLVTDRQELQSRIRYLERDRG